MQTSFKYSEHNWDQFLPQDIDWILDRMEALDYKPDRRGLCKGLSYVALIAALSSESHVFYRRLQIINSIPVHEFASYLDGLNEKRKKLIEEAKNENSNGFDNLSPEELSILENQPEMLKKISDLKLISSYGLFSDKKLQTVEFEKRKKNILRNAYLQEKIEKKLLQMPEDERIALDIPAFFNSIELNQRPWNYPDVFSKEEVITKGFQKSVTLSKKLEQDGIIESAPSSCACDSEALKAYFDVLTKSLASLNPSMQYPLGLIMQNGGHVIFVTFDPLVEKWQVAEQSILGIFPKQFENPATWTADGLSPDNGNSVFMMTMYARQNDKIAFNQLTENLKHNVEWQALHTVTQAKANLVDDRMTSWLDMAVEMQDIEKVKQLLACKADVNVICSYADIELTPLARAISTNNCDIVKLLLNAEANPDIGSIPPLFLAAQNNQLEIVNLLLQCQEIDTSKPLISTEESLRSFASNHNVVEAMEKFLQQNKNIDKEKIAVTPMEIAEIMGHQTIVQAIDQKNKSILNTSSEESINSVKFT